MLRQIKLSKGKLAIVDNNDFKRLNKYKWSYGGRYAVRGNKPVIRMHWEVIGKPKKGGWR